jgi:hypothetical protein
VKRLSVIDGNSDYGGNGHCEHYVAVPVAVPITRTRIPMAITMSFFVSVFIAGSLSGFENYYLQNGSVVSLPSAAHGNDGCDDGSHTADERHLNNPAATKNLLMGLIDRTEDSSADNQGH